MLPTIIKTGKKAFGAASKPVSLLLQHSTERRGLCGPRGSGNSRHPARVDRRRGALRLPCLGAEGCHAQALLPCKQPSGQAHAGKAGQLLHLREGIRGLINEYIIMQIYDKGGWQRGWGQGWVRSGTPWSPTKFAGRDGATPGRAWGWVVMPGWDAQQAAREAPTPLPDATHGRPGRAAPGLEAARAPCSIAALLSLLPSPVGLRWAAVWGPRPCSEG